MECEKCKIQLIDFQQSEIKIKLPNETIDIPISREEFEELCEKKNYWKKIENLINYCVEDADLELEDIKEIVFIGESIKIPKVKEIIKKIFPNVNINDSLNPDEIVAKGAAIQAKMIINGSTKGFTDVTNYSLGTDLIDGKFSCIIPKNSNILISISENYVLFLIIKLELILEYMKVKIKNIKKIIN